MPENIISSKILSEHTGVIHGVSTKIGGVAPYYNNLSKHVGDSIDVVLQNRIKFFGELSIDGEKCAHANQIHSGNVTAVDKPGLYKQTDALVTNQNGLYLVISVADCLPVMIYDKEKRVIANIHSGWRGAEQKITVNAINKMINEFNCDLQDMVAYIGPGISRDKFEVGPEVAELFEEKYIMNIYKQGFIKETNKFYIDLKQVVIDQILSCGVKPENIESSPYCTYTEKDMLHSYRRDGAQSGRMFAVIGMKSNKNK